MRIVGDRFVLDETTEPKDGVMAEVFRAVDSRHQMRPVAVKLFKDGFLDSKLTLEAFSRETKSLDELNEYPGIAKLIDCGTDKITQRKFIALEWVDFNLVDFLKQNPVRNWNDFYQQYGRPILQALCFAYAKGIIHRDVKPQNILVTTEGQIRVCDFGISKFKKYYRPGTTLVSFASAPYAPKERDSGEYADSRDCHGFAVLALEAVGKVDLEPDADVSQLISELGVPSGVTNLLLRAVSSEPAERPRNVQDLLDEFESLHLEGSLVTRKLPIHLRITNAALEALRLELNNASNARIFKYVAEDLNEAFGFDYWRSVTNGAIVESEKEFALFGVEFRYRVVVDDTCSGRLSVLWAVRVSPSRLEAIRDRCWSGNLQFEIGSPPDIQAASDAVQFVISSVGEFGAVRRQQESKRKESAIFEKWSTMLRLSEDLQRDKEHPIRFDDGVVEDAHSLTLRVTTTPDPELIGQARVVRVDGRNLAAGIVDSVTEQHIRLSTELPLSEDEIGRGEIVVDTRLERTSIDRQAAALNAVQFDRARRTDLRQLLVFPSTARLPTSREVEKFFNSDLDESQKDIVRAALGVEDFLVVEGPPGTGKTKFIAELILQILSENPAARIVLSSQTHNALDNAIERVRPLAAAADIDVSIIRIALRTDSRVSENVRALILENQVEIWLDQVRKKSQEFLEKWANSNGLSKRSIEIGLAIAAYRTSRGRVEDQGKQLSVLDNAIQALEAEEQRLRSDEKGADKLEGVTTRLEQFRRDAIDARGLIAQQRKDLAAARKSLENFGGDGKDFVSFTDDELVDWEKNYLEASSDGKKLRTLIEMADEWYARFGRSKDFFGAFVADAHVIAGTCVAVTGRGLQDVHFDYCIVDEASKATPTEILVPISKSRRWIVVGDPNQLSPFKIGLDRSKRRLVDYELSKEDLDETLLDVLLRGLPKECRKKLNFQHRMVRQIGELVSHCFYGGTLDNSLAAQSKIDLKGALPRPVTWFSTSRMNDRRETEVGTSFRNLSELRVIRRLLLKIQQVAASQNVNMSVVMLAGYVPQVLELRRIAASLTTQLVNLTVECQSVDRYQGREADLAIYSIARSNPEGKIGFLGEVERLNVALSRARIGLAIVGDSHFCSNVHGENPFRQVIDHIKGHRSDCSLIEAAS